MELVEIQKQEINILKEAAISCIWKQIVGFVEDRTVCVSFRYPNESKSDQTFFLDLERENGRATFCIRDWADNEIIKEKTFKEDHWSSALLKYLQENIEEIIKESRCFTAENYLEGDHKKCLIGVKMMR